MMQVPHRGLRALQMIAAMQDQPVMGVMLKIRWNIVLDGAFDRVHVLARADAGAVADAEDMGVHRLCRACRHHMFSTTLAVLRPTPGRDCSAARELGTSPP